MSEKLVKVERFDELATGVRIEIRGCDMCERSHKGILLDYLEMAEALDQFGHAQPYAGFDLTPLPDCAPPVIVFAGRLVEVKHCLIGPRDVDSGRIWRWVDFDEKQAEERYARHDVLSAELNASLRGLRKKVGIR